MMMIRERGMKMMIRGKDDDHRGRMMMIGGGGG